MGTRPPVRLPSRVEIDRELLLPKHRAGGRLGLSGFVVRAWHVVEPSTAFVPGWHVDLICDHLEAVMRGELHNLLINIPPGYSKSLLVSVLWPAWSWTFRPGTKWIYGSYADTLSLRDAGKMRLLLESDWYQERWGHLWKPARVWGTEEFANDAGGFRFSTSVGGGTTGRHGEILVFDDPIKPRDVMGGAGATRTVLTKCVDWWQGTMASRLLEARPGQPHAKVGIMQRLHEADLAGHCLNEVEDSGRKVYHHVYLPQHFRPERRCVTKWGRDPREKEGELLCPGRFDEAGVKERARAMGGQAIVAAQEEQTPNPAGGGTFKQEWFSKRWRNLPDGGRWFQSWDCSFKEIDTSDFVAGGVWYQKGASLYLVDQVHARLSFGDTCRAIAAKCARWPLSAGDVLVEDKANGSAVISVMRNVVTGLNPVEPYGGKEARAQATAPTWEAGNVYLPANGAFVPHNVAGRRQANPEDDTHVDTSWVDAYIQEHLAFPVGVKDDWVDMTSQAIMNVIAEGIDYEAQADAMLDALGG